MEEDLNQFDDYVIRKSLLKISRREIEKCEKENKVPSKDILDTINTLINFQKINF